MATWTHHIAQQSDLDDFIEEASLDPDFRHAYEDARNRSVLLRNLIRARKLQRISQSDVAKFMGTTQSAVSDLEGGQTDPYLSTLQRYARAVNAQMKIGLSFATSATAALNLDTPWRTAEASRRVFLSAVAAARNEAGQPSVVFEDCA